ncbi:MULTISPECIES: PadR family transcriptional regulator [unclassified Streptomyces]|uniref:PadR family transcriptional regulator n=1 Tax=unclassified Streptomyces TaxID=2593676 RepID=UPI00166090B3|nr:MULTISPECIES: PadR family transcriptional regulator [unclassified Streptomyces]
MQLDYVILGVLTLRRLSGYDLRRWMAGPGRFIGYDVQLPQIYRKLARLVEDGKVTFDIDPREGRPDAKVYRLTEEGRQAFLAWARSPFEPSPRPRDPEFTLRFVFAGQVSPEIALDIVNTELAYRVAQRPAVPSLPFPDKYEPQIPELDEVWIEEVHTMAHERGYSHGASYIAWLELVKARLERRLGVR